MESKQKFYLASVILALTAEGKERDIAVNRVAKLANKVFPEVNVMSKETQSLFFKDISTNSIKASKQFAQAALDELEKEFGGK